MRVSFLRGWYNIVLMCGGHYLFAGGVGFLGCFLVSAWLVWDLHGLVVSMVRCFVGCFYLYDCGWGGFG